RWQALHRAAEARWLGSGSAGRWFRHSGSALPQVPPQRRQVPCQVPECPDELFAFSWLCPCLSPAFSRLVTLALPRRGMHGEEVLSFMRSTTTRSGFDSLIRDLAGAVALTFALSVSPSLAADEQAPQQTAQHKTTTSLTYVIIDPIYST